MRKLLIIVAAAGLLAAAQPPRMPMPGHPAIGGGPLVCRAVPTASWCP